MDFRYPVQWKCVHQEASCTELFFESGSATVPHGCYRGCWTRPSATQEKENGWGTVRTLSLLCPYIEDSSTSNYQIFILPNLMLNATTYIEYVTIISSRLAITSTFWLYKLEEKSFCFCFCNFEGGLGCILLGLFPNRNSWNKPNICSFSGYSDSRVAVKPS